MSPNEEPLTEAQKKVLDFIQSHLEEFGRPPTVREVMHHFEWNSPQSARKHLLALEDKGYLTREDHTARGLKLVESVETPQGLVLPLIGRVAAGLPILAEENRDGSLVVDPSLARGRKTLFALNVKGDSMLNAHILPGDKIIVQQTTHAETGEVVVALLDGEATVKTFRRSGHKMWLEPANPKYDNIYVTESTDFRIIGKVVGVFSPR
jgi:repressor LexA